MVYFNKKKRRHSGWSEGSTTLKAKKDYIINNCLEPQLFWDDWNDYRDGFRKWYKDLTKIKPKTIVNMHRDYMPNLAEINWKLKQLAKRRKINKDL